uniref:Uncharacterized protein n=1 Tax=Anguilla anguilla TaxID=7936 RepID=A0A0E9T855_ANGAN
MSMAGFMSNSLGSAGCFIQRKGHVAYLKKSESRLKMNV